MDEELKIVFQVEGMDSEGGHVRLDHLLTQLDLLRKSLERVDVMVDNFSQPSAYYRVVAASHSSPLTITLEPVPRITKARVPTRKRLRAGHDLYFKEFNAIRAGLPPSPSMDDDTLLLFQKLLNLQGKTFKTATIHNNAAIVPLDEQLKRNVDFYLRDADVSFGSLSGSLDKVNIHGEANTFWIFPPLGPKKVMCKFPPDSKEMLREALGNVVEVTGLKHFRPKCPYPHRIDVREFSIIEKTNKSPLLEARDKPLQDETDSVAEINTMRDDEW